MGVADDHVVNRHAARIANADLVGKVVVQHGRLGTAFANRHLGPFDASADTLPVVELDAGAHLDLVAVAGSHRELDLPTRPRFQREKHPDGERPDDVWGRRGAYELGVRRYVEQNLDVMGGVDWFQYADTPIEDVRRQLGIPPKSADAIAAGSLSALDPKAVFSHDDKSR